MFYFIFLCSHVINVLDLDYRFYKKVDLSIAHSFALMMHSPWVFTELNFQSCFVGPRAVGSIERFVGHGWWHGLRTPNEGINQRNLKFWADVADKL